MDSPHYEYFCVFFLVPGDEFLAAQSTVIWILHSMNIYVGLWLVPGDEILATQITAI